MTVIAERHIELRGAARRLLSCRDPEVLLAGPAGTGKTVGGLTKLHLAAMKYPGSTHLLTRKTLVSLSSSTLEIWRKHVAAASLAIGEVDFYGGSREEPAQYRYLRNGSKIVVGGLDKPSKIMSSAYDLIVVDEATETLVGDWEALLTRGRAGNMPYSQLIGLCNPDAEHHYLYQRHLAGALTLFHSLHEHNPAYFNVDGSMTTPGEAYIGRLDKLTGVRYQRLRHGRWVAAEGAIYEEWSPAVHLVDALPAGSETWTRWWAVDFGYRNPFVLQCWAEDGDGRLWLYREIYMTGRLVEDHARHILGIVAPGGRWIEPRPRAIICDHDAEDKATLERHLHMSTVNAKKTVKPGIEAVQARLRVAGDALPRLLVVRDALVVRDESLAEAGKPTCTKDEVTGYVWAKGADGRPIKEEPHKENDHGCLVAGTLITTARGDMPIEHVGQGDRVATRKGWRTVLAAGMTQRAAQVLTATLSTGQTITGTGDHPIWVDGAGWVRLDALRYGDRLLSWSRAVDSEASFFGATQILRTGQSAHTSSRVSPIASAGGSASMRRSGARRTARFPMVTRFITSISNRRTTLLSTLRAFRSVSTRSCIAGEVGSEAASAVGRQWHDALLPSGTAVRPVAPGTLNTVSARGTVRSIAFRRVNNAQLNFRRAPGRKSSVSVRINASRRGVGRRALMTLIDSAVNVARGSEPIVTRPSSHAAVCVVRVSAVAERQPVYNLTVEGAPEYFANGVLVHNCDAMRYVVAERDLGGRPALRALRY